MKKTAYVIASENYKLAFSKGFLNKSLHVISQAVGSMIPPWKASFFYDDRLTELGSIIAVGKCNLRDEEVREQVSEQVGALCDKYDIGAVCSEVPLSSEPLRRPLMDGRSIAFFYRFLEEWAQGRLNHFTQVGVVVGPHTPESFAPYLADRFNYLSLYSRDGNDARRFAERMYAYNGTAAQVSGQIGALRLCGAVLVLEERSLGSGLRFSGEIRVIDPFAEIREEVLKTKVYTNKLGEMTLQAPFLEAAYYNFTGKRPIQDLESYEVHVKSIFFPELADLKFGTNNLTCEQ